jgi:hypothetical protein
MCGLRVADAQAAAQPPTQPMQQPYAQPQQPYGQPPYPQAYGAPAGPPPSKGMAMAGGIMGIVISSLYLLIGLLAMIGGAVDDDPDAGGAVAGGAIFLVFGLAGVIFGVFAVKARWWGCMVGGILQSILALLLLAAYAGISDAESKAGVFAEINRSEIDTVKTVVLVWLLITAAVAIFNYIGIVSAKNYERAASRSHLRAAEQF